MLLQYFGVTKSAAEGLTLLELYFWSSIFRYTRNMYFQVYDKYPGHDLIQKKDFIKAAVKEVIGQ